MAYVSLVIAHVGRQGLQQRHRQPSCGRRHSTFPCNGAHQWKEWSVGGAQIGKKDSRCSSSSGRDTHVGGAHMWEGHTCGRGTHEQQP